MPLSKVRRPLRSWALAGHMALFRSPSRTACGRELRERSQSRAHVAGCVASGSRPPQAGPDKVGRRFAVPRKGIPVAVPVSYSRHNRPPWRHRRDLEHLRGQLRTADFRNRIVTKINILYNVISIFLSKLIGKPRCTCRVTSAHRNRIRTKLHQSQGTQRS
jgi:hypothetical protein